MSQPQIVYQGPPRWTGRKWENGDRFTLSGRGKADLGVELSGSVSGLDRPTEEYRYDTGANTPGSRLVGSVAGRRELLAGINILGDNPRDLRVNKNRWERNNSTKEPGRLWVLTEEGQPRYLSAYKAETAGTAAVDKDPHIRSLYEDWDWGWTSDDPYFKGYLETRELERVGSSGTYEANFFNSSTAPAVYPKLLLYGPGRFRVPAGYGLGDLNLPTIGAGQVMRLDYDPAFKTLLVRNLSGGLAQNIWNELKGERPHLSFEPETHNTFSVRNVAGGAPRPPELVYTPLFNSWV